ncbi:MAG: hypothetical protein L6262_10805 [Weeksellaceae bacterium]|nr:hypothetical protein [Weeksellaceae bacterium]
METLMTPKPVYFKFSQYINQGFELLKANFMPIFLATLCTLVMSIIPFCNVLAISNLLQFIRKIDKGEAAEPSEIFNFDDFMKYFIPMLLIFAGFIVLYIPYFAILALSGVFNGDQPSGFLGAFLTIYMIFFVFAIFYFVLKGFYIIGLMSLKGISTLKEAWNVSKVMTTGNLIMIFFFSIVVGFLGEIGIILCGIGLFFTIPFVYCAQYFAYADGISQIENTENVVELPAY